MPSIPKALPPTVTATKTSMLGSPTDLPTTLGYMMFPSTSLHRDDKYHKPYRLYRVYKQYQKCTDTRTDEGTENRYQRRYAYEDGNHQRIGHAQYQHADKAKQSVYQNLGKLTCHEV